jgi:hypothetical protein
MLTTFSGGQIRQDLLYYEKLGKENIFKPMLGNESLHQVSDDHGGRIVDFAT